MRLEKKQLWPVILKKSNFWITLGIYGSSSLILKLAPPTPLPPYPTPTKKRKRKRKDRKKGSNQQAPRKESDRLHLNFRITHVDIPNAPFGHVIFPYFGGKGMTKFQRARGWSDHECSRNNFTAWEINRKSCEDTYYCLHVERRQRCFNRILSVVFQSIWTKNVAIAFLKIRENDLNKWANQNSHKGNSKIQTQTIVVFRVLTVKWFCLHRVGF